MAYTSASTALNQKLFAVKVNAKEPTRALPKTANFLEGERISSCPAIFLTSKLIDQNINRMVKALEKTDTIFTISAT